MIIGKSCEEHLNIFSMSPNNDTKVKLHHQTIVKSGTTFKTLRKECVLRSGYSVCCCWSFRTYDNQTTTHQILFHLSYLSHYVQQLRKYTCPYSFNLQLLYKTSKTRHIYKLVKGEVAWLFFFVFIFVLKFST